MRSQIRHAMMATAALSAMALVVPADAALNDRAYLNVTGPGAKRAGKAVNVGLGMAVSDSNPALVPARVSDVIVRSRTLKFNARARGLRTCTASLPTNGAAARCPSRSKVGSGKFKAVFGFPGQPIATIDPAKALSSGRITIYNYKRQSGQQARLLAVITASVPVNYTVNLPVPVTRSGVATIVMPDMKDLAPIVRDLYPAGTRLVTTSFDAKVRAKSQRRGKPFMYLRTLKRLEIRVTRNVE
jgi:hypothetical protein